MNRSLKLSMLVALALGSSQVLAMDLGQIRVKSALGQPLLAEIPLHPASPAELQNLSVQLASSEEFARAGITGGRTTIPLHFAVTNAGGQRVIRITSTEAVDDPYLDLLIEVNGRAGKSVREYAILLDPPGSLMEAAGTSAPAPSRAPSTAAATAAPSHASAPAQAAAPGVSDGRYGPVARGQTLSSIARNTVPLGVDLQQMMLALKQANPDAFYRDNINALKTGAVLRVPTATEARAVALAAAIAEVRRQNNDWRAGTPSAPVVVADAASRADATGAPSGAAGDSGDRLALVPANAGKGTAGDGSANSSASREELLRARESLASSQQQSKDLEAQVKDLTDIKDKNEHLLSLKDSQIAELQAKLAAAGAPAPAATAADATAPLATATSSETPAGANAATDMAALAPAATVADTAMPADASSAAPTTTSPAVVPASEPASAAAPPVESAPAAPMTTPAPAVAVQPWYLQTWAWIAAAAVLVLLILLAMLGRRRKAVAPRAPSSLADRFGPVAPGGAPLAGEDVDQEELLDQLAEHPDDIGLHLELVTLYYSRRDVEHFEAAAEAMYAHVVDPQQEDWQEVERMGEDLVPAHPLFDHHPELPLDEESEARRQFDIDDYAADDAPTVVSPMPPLPAAPRPVSEYSFDFDLSQPPAPPAEDATVISPIAYPEAAGHDATASAEADWPTDAMDDEPAAPVHDLGEFSDDPIDTKLDLARAYVDMGDADGARAMLGEVIKEGSQTQRDTARRLLESLA